MSEQAPRRIDISIERLREEFDRFDQSQRLALTRHPAWDIVDIVLHLRAMERAELEVSPNSTQSIADAYDSVVLPGDNLLQAFLDTFRHAFASELRELPV